jgi:hypothetical protein
VTLLSPSAWTSSGCALGDSGVVRRALTHELIHVLHEHWNPKLGEMAAAIPWFVEGLAVHGSGQLPSDYAVRVFTIVLAGQAPTSLAAIWHGPLRYGVAGSMVKHLDDLVGRAVLRDLLTATDSGEILAAVGLDEADLMAGWRASVRKAR